MTRALLISFRPVHWVKNVFVWAPVFFSGHALEPDRVIPTAIAFAAFCTTASAVYLLNDILDRSRDAAHPLKQSRPIASGELPVSGAIGALLVLGAVTATATLWLPAAVVYVLLAYVSINLAYSLHLKHVMVIDVFCIAIGFVLRLVAGGYAADITLTPWLVMATFFLALFLALEKRRGELLALVADSTSHRPVLKDYTVELADKLVSVVTPVMITVYVLYTLDDDIQARFDSELLYLTTIFVLAGVFRYLYLTHIHNLGGTPTENLFRDTFLFATVLGWVCTFLLIIYVL